MPPAAAPLQPIDMWHGAIGLVRSSAAIAAFEDELKRYFRAKHVFLVSSGTAALTVTLKALAADSGRREVIVPAYTCFTVPAAVVQAGLEPVLCDIERTTFDLDRAQLTPLVTDRTLCVIAHHLFGIPSDLARVRAICGPRGVPLIEDAAQAMGVVDDDGRWLGTVGDVGIFSLGRGKHVTCGAGGVILTNSDRIAEAIRQQYRDLPTPGVSAALAGLIEAAAMAVCIRPSLYWIPAGLPFLRLGETIYPTRITPTRLSGVHAGLMRRMRVRLQRALRARARTADDLKRRLNMPAVAGRKDGYLRLPVFAASAAGKQRLVATSRMRGLGIAEGYPTAVNDIPQLQSRFSGQCFPNAERAARHLLTVPTHHWLTEHDMRALVRHLGGAVGSWCPPDEAAIERQGA